MGCGRSFYRPFVIISLLVLGYGLGVSTKQPAIIAFSHGFSHLLQRFTPSWLVYLMVAVSLMEYLLLLFIPLLSLWLWHKRKRPLALAFLLSGLSWLLIRWLKSYFQEPCPDITNVALLMPVLDVAHFVEQSPVGRTLGLITRAYCYPSGHTFEYLTFFGLLLRARRLLTSVTWGQRFIYFLSLFMIIMVGISRVFLGAHWITDVVGSYLFGLAWLIGLHSLFKL